MNQPVLGVCIIVRDAAKTIDALLESILDTPQGPAFDEYVIVDTGSTDDTREHVERAFGLYGPVLWDGKPTRVAVANAVVRLTLAPFEWIDDFAAARNYSYALATAKWRFYLDADDTFPNAQRLRPTLQRTEQVSPNTNCICLPYDYSPGEMVQDKLFRGVRWADGWKWIDEIHESLVRDPAGPRVISRYGDLIVKHHHSEEHTTQAIGRNIRICEGVREKALAAGDARKAALMAYYLGGYAGALHQDEMALQHYAEASAGLGENNLSCEARVARARLHVSRGELDAALEWAAQASARTPEMLEGHAILGVTLALKGDYPRAKAAFDRMYATEAPPVASMRDQVFMDGLVPSTAADVCVKLGDFAGAVKALSHVGEAQRDHPNVWPIFARAGLGVQKLRAQQAVVELWNTLVTFDEPLKARAALDMAPALIADSPAIAELRRYTNTRLKHVDGGWAAYKAVYDAPLSVGEDAGYNPDTTDKEFIRSFGRAKAVREWAAGLPTEGPPIEVLSIGPCDSTIEHDLLASNARIVLSIADVSEKATRGIDRLMVEFPLRVFRHVMTTGPLDWPKQEFDVVLFFEVLEHLPYEHDALRELRYRLKEDGILFLSTPVAGYWPNPDNVEKPVWLHVRANSPSMLWSHLQRAGFTGSLDATDNRGVFLAKLKRAPTNRTPHTRLSIFVGGTPHPFDPEAHLHGHLGGSEEAVIYLAPALQRMGFEVTVYAPRPERSDRSVIHVRDDVLWRDVEDFDFSGDHGRVLFWRCPQVLLDPRVQAAQYRKYLWLHDATYRAPVEAYKSARKVIVLSKFHGEIIAQTDGYMGPFAYATNGIDLNLYPELTPEGEAARDPHKVIYGSSPDRGLDHLLAAWPYVRAAIPDATLEVCYTWDLLEKAMAKNPELKEAFGLLRFHAENQTDLGVTSHGGVDHVTLAKLYHQASAWAYPCLERFPVEISCITAMKAQAAGCWPVVTRCGALPETLFGNGLDARRYCLGTDRGARWFADQIIAALTPSPLIPDHFVARKEMSDRARLTYGWDNVAAKFAAILED